MANRHMNQVITSLNQIDYSFLKNFNKIIVSGPQRSGTNLVSQHIFKQFFDFAGWQFVDELEFDFFIESNFADKIKDPMRMVIQAPTMSHILHTLNRPDIFVFFCVRPIKDILRSEEKARWDGQTFERANYRREDFDLMPIAQAKYHYWFFEQRLKMQCNFAEAHFSAFESSEVWSDKKKTGFQPDTSWKPDSARDDGDRWAYVHGPNGPESMRVAKYWFEKQEEIDKCRIQKK